VRCDCAGDVLVSYCEIRLTRVGYAGLDQGRKGVSRAGESHGQATRR
jgi:hypothetical protein